MEAEEGGLNILDVALKALVKLCRDPSRPIRLNCQHEIFIHLDYLARNKSHHSPALYKLLTFSFIENYDDEITREFMTHCFTDLFESQKNIPVSTLLEPLLRKIKDEEIMEFDRKLLSCLIHHKKLKLEKTSP